MESVCSICSKPCPDCDVVEETTRELLEVLLIDIKTKFGSDPLMCSGCKNELLKCFEFKGKCIYTEDLMYPYIDAKNDSKVDIGTIYRKTTGLNKRLANPRNLRICRLCIKRVNGNFHNISEDTLRKYNVDEMFFQKFLPELNLNVTEAPIMCENCLTCLRRFAKFASCLPMAKEMTLSNTKNKENKGTSTSLRINNTNVCKYCKQKETNIRRHIESLHNNEAEVKEFMLMSDDNPKKLELLAQIRRDGTFRKIEPSSHASGNSYLKEVNRECKKKLTKDSSSNHLNKSSTKSDSELAKGMLPHSKAISENVHVRANGIVRETLFPALREGPVKEAIRFDELIILYANEMSSKYRSQHYLPMIRNDMIRMAEVLLEIQRLDESAQTFKDILKPQIFDKLMDVVDYMGEYNLLTGKYKKPKLPTELGTSLKYVTKLYISECIKNNKMQEKSLALSFLHLLQTSLPAHVKMMSELHGKQKTTSVAELPSLDDITKLINYVLTQRDKYFRKLNVKFDLGSWINLSSYTLISVFIFNRRRSGEIEKSLVLHLENSTTIGEERDIFKEFDSLDQALIREYVRFVIRRDVSVLLDKSMNKCLKLLMKYRKDAGVIDNNPYIFALPQFRQVSGEEIYFRHLQVGSLMMDYSEACGAINPQTLRAIKLRKRVTTLPMTLDSNNEVIHHLQGFLRHADEIDLEYYRRPMSDRSLLTVIKILMVANGELPLDALKPATKNESTDLAPSPSAATTVSDSIESTSKYEPSGDDSTDEDICPKPTHKRPRLLGKLGNDWSTN